MLDPQRRILPGQLWKAVIGEDVTRTGRAQPVDDRAVRRRGRKSIRLCDDPGGEDAAAAAAGHEQVVRIDEPLLEHNVDACQQIGVVGTRVGVRDHVAEFAAVAGAATWIREEYDIVVSHVLLPAEIEPGAVHAVRTTMDV